MQAIATATRMDDDINNKNNGTNISSMEMATSTISIDLKHRTVRGHTIF